MVLHALGKFFSVIAKSETYLNLLYLLISFPLGIFYFVFLITGFSLGLGLIITLLGIPLLIAMLYAWWGLAWFERKLMILLLRIKIPYKSAKLLKEKNLWKRLIRHLKDATTWTSLAHLFLRFPLGILNFVLVVTLLTASLALIATPLIYYLGNIGVIPFDCSGSICLTNSYGMSLLWCLIGMLLLFVSLNLLNLLTKIEGVLAKALLERK